MPEASMYNVLEKLRSGEALTDKDKVIHEEGLVSVLKKIHDDLDAAVFDAYGWPHDLTDEQILERLVALNAERGNRTRSAMPPSPAPCATTFLDAQPPPAPTPVKLTSDTEYTTDKGTTFTATAGWTVLKVGAGTILTGPEPDLRIAIVDTPEPTADEAVAAGWRALRPDFNRPLRLKSARPGRHGWDETQKYDYETSPEEKLVVAASASRHGPSWTAVLLESGEASFEKRLGKAAPEPGPDDDLALGP